MAERRRFETNKERVLELVGEAGAELVLTSAIEGLERLLVRNQLSTRLGGEVQRATLYRLVANDREVVAAVADRVASPEWSGFEQVLDRVMDAYNETIASITNRLDLERYLKGMLAMNFEAQFLSPGTPAGWVLQSAALTSSEAWKDQHPEPELRHVGQQILAGRAAFYDRMQARLVDMFDLTLSHFGRRPRPGLTTDDIVMAMMAMMDGFVLRRFADPNRVSAATVADRLFEVGWSMTESGPGYDPRRPAGSADVVVFDETVAMALDRWADGPLDRDRARVEAPCGPERFVAWFPTDDDLADSAARALFATLGLAFHAVDPDHVSGVIKGGLTALANAVDEQPALFAVVAASGWETKDGGVLHELRQSLEVALRTTPVRRPEDLALGLVRLALQGRAGLAEIGLRLTFTRPG